MTRRHLSKRPAGIPAHVILPTDLQPHLDCTLQAAEGWMVLHNWIITYESMDGVHVQLEMAYNPAKNPVRAWRRLAKEVDAGGCIMLGCDAPMAAMVSVHHRAKLVEL